MMLCREWKLRCSHLILPLIVIFPSVDVAKANLSTSPPTCPHEAQELCSSLLQGGADRRKGTVPMEDDIDDDGENMLFYKDRLASKQVGQHHQGAHSASKPHIMLQKGRAAHSAGVATQPAAGSTHAHEKHSTKWKHTGDKAASTVQAAAASGSSLFQRDSKINSNGTTEITDDANYTPTVQNGNLADDQTAKDRTGMHDASSETQTTSKTMEILLMETRARTRSLLNRMWEHFQFMLTLRDAQTVPLVILLVVLVVFAIGAAYTLYPYESAAEPDYRRSPLHGANLTRTPLPKGEIRPASPIAPPREPQRVASPLLQNQPPVRTNNFLFADAKSPQPSKRGPVQEPGLPFLCPELVVPEASECTLVVPRLALKSHPSKGTVTEDPVITIDDARGVAVFRAALTDDNGSSGTDALDVQQGKLAAGRTQDQQRLVLSSGAGDAVFAYCRLKKATASSNIGNVITVYHHSDAPFGEVVTENAETGSYVVKTRTGWGPRCMNLRGDKMLGNITATNESGRLLAIAESMNDGTSRRSVRIGPLVDAGFVVLSLLGIDMLEYADKEAASRKRI